jgi:XTP/dITP diphosphohydrolase
MDVTFVTSNPGKIVEVRRILAEFEIGVEWSRRSLPEPQTDDLKEVVRAKLAAAAKSGLGVVVEDSGLFIEPLRDFPGVYSRYVLDTVGLEGVLRLTQGRPAPAEFRAVAGYRRGTRTVFGTGVVRGTIAPEPLGENGFGYDPIFIPEGERETFGEMDATDKDALSHRGLAIRALGRQLSR